MTQREKEQRNARVQARYDELMQDGKHGHYETLFRIVREEVEAAQPVQPSQAQPDTWVDDGGWEFPIITDINAKGAK